LIVRYDPWFQIGLCACAAFVPYSALRSYIYDLPITSVSFYNWLSISWPSPWPPFLLRRLLSFRHISSSERLHLLATVHNICMSPIMQRGQCV